MPPLTYQPFVNPYADSMANLLARRGEIAAQQAERVGAAQAQAAQASGNAWGRAISDAGQIGQQVMQTLAEAPLRRQQAEAQRMQLDAAKRDAAAATRADDRDQKFRAILQSGQIPSSGQILSIYGPVDGVKVAQGIAAFAALEGQKSTDARADIARVANAIKVFKSPDMQSAMWPQLRAKVAAANLIDGAQLPEQLTPDVLDGVIALATGQTPKQSEPFTLNPGDVRFGPDGKPIAENPRPVDGPKPGDYEWVTRGGQPMQIVKGTAQPGDRPYQPPTQGPQPGYQWVIRNGQRVYTIPQAGDEPASQARPATQTQFMAAGYAARIKQSDDVLKNLESTISGRGLMASAYAATAPSRYQSAEQQQFDQASRNFINAVLRRESGAAISQSEFDNAEKQYLPQAGDSKEVLAQKAQNRKTVFDTMRREGGAAYEDDTPKVGERRVINGQVAEWDGHGWLPAGK